MAYSIPLPDHSTRPKAPKIEGAHDGHRRHGRRLAQFHAMHLDEIARVRRLMVHIESEGGAPERIADAVKSMKMVSNFQLFGNLCGGTCDMLTAHHSIEDAWIFPDLHDRSDGLRAVVDRLIMEHGVIHQMLVDMEKAAIALIEAPDASRFDTLRTIFETLEGFVISHFGYEQTELEEALGFYDVDL